MAAPADPDLSDSQLKTSEVSPALRHGGPWTGAVMRGLTRRRQGSCLPVGCGSLTDWLRQRRDDPAAGGQACQTPSTLRSPAPDSGRSRLHHLGLAADEFRQFGDTKGGGIWSTCAWLEPADRFFQSDAHSERPFLRALIPRRCFSPRNESPLLQLDHVGEEGTGRERASAFPAFSPHPSPSLVVCPLLASFSGFPLALPETKRNWDAA